MISARSVAAVAVAAALTVSTPFSAQAPAGDKEGVRLAALDYLEGIYNVQPERIERSVHPTLNKRGFYKKDPRRRTSSRR